MKSLRLFLSLGLVAVLLACSTNPNGPLLPFGPTYTPRPSVTPTVTATSTPSPTPSPLVRVESGDHALFNGDYDLARAEYQQALNQSGEPALRVEALWGLGRTEYEAGNYDGAISYFNQITNEYPGTVRGAQAHFLLGEAYYALDRYADAAAQYGAYLSLRAGLIDAYALEVQGDAYFDAQNYIEALGVYNSANLAPRLDNGIDLQIKVAQTRTAIGDYATALALYDAIAAQTGNDYVKAQMDYLAGSAYLHLDQPENAHPRFLHAVENYPLSYYSYLSLVELVDANVTVSDLDRGLVDYFAAQYDVALAALDRYLGAGLDSDGTARFYRALTLEALDRDVDALDDYSKFINGFPNNDHWAEAWSKKASLQWIDLGDYVGASQTLRDFAAVAPSHPQAEQFLMDAARVLERDNRLEEAALVWEQIADQFPGSSRAEDAIFLAGISFYRLGDFQRALNDFQRGLLFAIAPEGKARALLWIGKAQEKLGDAAEAQKSWAQAQSLDPTGYYSERARDLILGRAPFAPPAIVKLDVDLAAERVEAASWVRVTFGLPADTDLSSPGPLVQDPRFVRGTEFWQLGLYDLARLEFESLRESVNASPADSFRLANYLIDIGLYRSGITTARQVLTLAGLDEHSESLQVAKYFSHLRYGLYYRDLIEPAAQENGLDALFLFSVVRQESLFEGFVRSTAGARGLMQIVPSTGASVASQLGWPPFFDPKMLYQPNVSVRLGAHYLATNRFLLDGDMYAALAAYNAGPGNAIVWHNLAGGDPDLFLEIVRFAETRDYIRGIYEIFNIYRTLYSPIQ